MSLRTIQALTEAGVMASVMYRLDNPVEQWWAPLVRRVGSIDPNGQTHGWLGGAPEMKEQTGKPSGGKPRANTFAVRNKKFASVIPIRAEDWDAAQKNPAQLASNIDALVQEGVNKAMMHPGTLLQEVIAAGESTACYDGSYFFHTAHSEGDSGTQDNDLAGTCVSAANPTASEMVDHILTSIAAVLGFKDDQGTEVNMSVRDFIVGCPLAYMKPVLKAINGELIGNGESNIIAGAKAGFNITAQVMPRWTGTKFAVFAKREALMGSAFIWQVFNDAAPEILGRESEHCKKNDELLFMVKGRYNIGYGRWQDACLMTLANA